MNWPNSKVLQKIVLLDEARDILVLKRVTTGPASRLGKWDLPGGSLGLDDLITDSKPHELAIIREVKEETGLELSNLKVVLVDSWVFEQNNNKILGIALGYCGLVTGVKPEVKLSFEHTEYEWLSKEELLKLDFGDDGGLHKKIVNLV